MPESPEEPDYPERWEADVVLSDGGTMAVRPIRPDDAERILAFHERQSPESIYFRFFSPRPRLSERDVERFTHVDYVDRMAFVGLIGDDLVGVARYDRHRARSDAEVAFFIDDDHHGRGMATVLLEYLAAAAREVGISGFTASVLPQNRKMLGVFTQAGFTARSHFEEGVIEVELGIEPTPAALAAIEVRAATAEARSVERILKPTSIAVVGASREPGTLGHQVFHQLVNRGFNGPVYPVNQEATFVASVRAWRSVLDVPGELDLAVICVPAEQVLRVVEECAVKRVQGLIVLSSGFADADAAGELAEARLVSYARRHGMRLIGPNALGVINTDPAVRMHATFVGVEPIPGRIGLMAQSGVIGAAIIDGARHVGLGISSFVAVGNKADVSGNDLLRYWQDDPETDVAMLYLESFGNPSKFSRTARALSQRKPVVAVKVGGAAGDRWVEPEGWPPDATAAALLEQTGVIRVDNLTQMFHTAGVLANQPLPAGNRVAVVTNSWGPAWLAVDALKASGLVPAEPVDLSNEAVPEQFTEALATVYADPDVDAVLVIYAPAVTTHYKKVGTAIREAAARPGAVTTVACLLGQHGPSTLTGDHTRVPQFPFPEEAALALGRVASYAAWRAQPLGTLPVLDPDGLELACELVAGWLDDAAPPAPPAVGVDGPLEPPTTRRWLDPLEAATLLATVGLQPVAQALADDEDEAVGAARRLGYPIALKASGLERLSKTEAGGVSLDVHGDDEVRDAYRRMSAVLGDAMHPAVVQAMVPEGAECRVGLFRHPVLGDVLTLGPGGSTAERVADEVMRILPLTDADAERLIDASVVGPLLDEQGPRARAALADLLVRLAGLADAVPEIANVRLNPVLVVAGSAAITDVRIGLQPFTPDTRPPVRRL
ncbi:GNAT family N-acetyltransferase [Aquihabitans sp. G128]|uniref:bifunctional acetate--CoA ligase family protein/GNAT family N-acetyltransferase n=1 Tax=Aquihabitans sp. G128 TaxID=2849779 RepID=UPI001C22D222|nr:GNAT family N-acetyltransferase [Aquihabitans sp. G128]QXC62165.1 GNAT family N-acetyltransferase [Aquihabitans sp. G128]